MKLQQYLNLKPRHRDLYFYLLRTTWSRIFIIFLIIYIGINLVFAGLYYVTPESINKTSPSFMDSFFFSIQTLSTIGYGQLSPTGILTNIFVTAQAFIGMILTATLTGIIFARISKPYANFRYSKPIILSDFDGQKNLSFRIGNTRENDIVEAKISLSVLIDEYTKEGQKFRRVYDLKLHRNHSPFFRLTLSLFHKVDKDSPLYEYEKVQSNIRAFVVTVTGHDGVYSTTVYDRYVYHPEDIVLNKYFVDIMTEDEAGNLKINYDKFDNLKEALVN